MNALLIMEDVATPAETRKDHMSVAVVKDTHSKQTNTLVLISTNVLQAMEDAVTIVAIP